MIKDSLITIMKFYTCRAVDLELLNFTKHLLKNSRAGSSSRVKVEAV